MRRAIDLHRRDGLAAVWLVLCGLTSATAQAQTLAPAPGMAEPAACTRPVYLTFDTGHMGTAPLIAEVLQRHQVKATFFAAHEKTQQGDGSLGEHWAAWWRARGAEGHAFASHTWEHAYWRDRKSVV